MLSRIRLTRGCLVVPPKQIAECTEENSLHDRQVTRAEKQRIRWDDLVITTGMRPRRLARQGYEANGFVVRTLNPPHRAQTIRQLVVNSLEASRKEVLEHA